MKIQKIFSDEQNEEKLYSVLLNEDELRFFGEIEGSSVPIDELLELGAISSGVAGAGEMSFGLLKKLKAKDIAKLKKIIEDKNLVKKLGVESEHSKRAIRAQAKRFLKENKTLSKISKSGGKHLKIGSGLTAAGLLLGLASHLKNKKDNEV